MTEVSKEVNPLSVWLARENYNALNQEVSRYLGIDLEQLAELDPKLAYDVLVSVVRSVTQPNLEANTTTDLGGGVILTTEQDGHAAALASSKAVENAMTQQTTGDVTVEVGVFDQGETAGGVVLQFVVELG